MMVGTLLLGGLGVGSPGLLVMALGTFLPLHQMGAALSLSLGGLLWGCSAWGFGPHKDTVHSSLHRKFHLVTSLETWGKFHWTHQEQAEPSLGWRLPPWGRWTLTLSGWGLAPLSVPSPQNSSGQKGSTPMEPSASPDAPCTSQWQQKGKRA